MSLKDSFSEAEWRALVLGPAHAGLAVAAAMGQVLRELINAQPRTELMQAIADDLSRHTTAAPTRWQGRDLEQIRAEALQAVRQASWPVRARASPEDARASAELVMRTAHRTAEAAREDGFMGIGGVPVKGAERETLAELEALVRPEPV